MENCRLILKWKHCCHTTNNNNISHSHVPIRRNSRRQRRSFRIENKLICLYVTLFYVPLSTLKIPSHLTRILWSCVLILCEFQYPVCSFILFSSEFLLFFSSLSYSPNVIIPFHLCPLFRLSMSYDGSVQIPLTRF